MPRIQGPPPWPIGSMSRWCLPPLEEGKYGRFPLLSVPAHSWVKVLLFSAIAEQDMRYAIGSKVPIPSSSLLRFLRTQSDEVCFFTVNSIARPSKCSSPRTGALFARCSPASRRRLSTSPRPLATVQASILNLDCLRPTSKNLTTNRAPTLQLGISPGLLASNDSKEKPSSSRYVSTNFRPLLEKVLNLRKADSTPTPDEPVPLPSSLDDVNGASIGRSKASRVNELKLRCTEFNEHGKVTLVNGEFKKTELIAKV